MKSNNEAVILAKNCKLIRIIYNKLESQSVQNERAKYTKKRLSHQILVTELSHSRKHPLNSDNRPVEFSEQNSFGQSCRSYREYAKKDSVKTPLISLV
jgi:hypothetical protein